MWSRRTEGAGAGSTTSPLTNERRKELPDTAPIICLSFSELLRGRLTIAAHPRRPRDADSTRIDGEAAAVGCSRWLATNSDEFASRDATDRLKDLRDERSQLFDTVGLCKHDDDADTGRAQVLLKLKILVHGQQGLEMLRDHQPEQFSVALRGPPHVNDVTNVVADQISLQWARHALIEQEQHALRSSHGQVRAPRLPARG